MVLAVIAVAHLAQADRAGHVLQFAVAVGGAGQAVERMVGDVELHHAAAQLRQTLGVWVRTFMPGSTGVVQEAGCRLRPSISTRQRRQEPKASSVSVAQSFGILMPDSIAARMTEVPAGTVTAWPSIVSVTVVAASAGRRAEVDLLDEGHGESSYLLLGAPRRGRRRKSSGKCFSALSTG